MNLLNPLRKLFKATNGRLNGQTIKLLTHKEQTLPTGRNSSGLVGQNSSGVNKLFSFQYAPNLSTLFQIVPFDYHES